ncbi:MAG TPA: gamma-D-glutamyl-meso-diaminopimelate peptidase [Ruminococcaceae bacterium]|nr:gamma-D-glutamyl-meso-diaminopimelate peptidase [Oscillospiraceae bacterium]
MNNIIKPKEYEYREICNLMYTLKGKYPFIELRSFGKSVLGKEIIGMEIGKGGSKVLFAGAFHGMERLTALILIKFAAVLSEAMSTRGDCAGVNARQGLLGKSLIIIPVVNPDGYDISLKGTAGGGNQAAKIKRLCGGDFHRWNANARGVDINHNFDAGWKQLREIEQEMGIYGPAPRRFGGYAPESEPETVALTDLCKNEDISHVLAFHSQGEIIYWNYGEHTPEKAKKMAKIMAASSGYALEEPMGISSHGGFKDWFIKEFSKPGFTIEIGRGENPLDPGELEAIYARVEEMMMLAAIM